MTKALLKKQMMEVFSWVYKDKKTGKLRSARDSIIYALLYLFLFGFLGSVFFKAAGSLCAPLVAMNMGWLYWCIMGLLSIFLGVFGGIFTTYGSMYQAKDNDFLLSMPIPASRILMARLLGVYALGLIYELIVMVPAMIAWYMAVPFSGIGSVFVILIPLILSVLVLTLSAVLGWVVALILKRVKHKNIIGIIASLAFIAIYYYVYSQAFELLQMILQNAGAIGAQLQSVLYPLYHMGLGAEGNLMSMVIFTAIVAAFFGVVYFLLSRSFLSLATAKTGSSKAAYKERKTKMRSAGGALLHKELRRFLGSFNYMMNCGLGILFMPVSAGLLIWKAQDIRILGSILEIKDFLPLLFLGGICLMAALNNVTAPSVSLEGKSLWLVQSLPVRGKDALQAKLKLHLLLTVVPMIPLVVVVEWLLSPTPLFGVMIPVIAVLFAFLTGAMGLAINLKLPILNWTNEIVPIKQSMSVLLSLFGGWVIIGLFAGLYALIGNNVGMEGFFALTCGVLLALDVLLYRWLQTRGARIFERL